MKFTVKHRFKTDRGVFEEGNSHDSETVGVSEERVLIWRENGWVDVEGMEPGPEAKPGSRRVRPQDVLHEKEAK